MRRNIYFFMLAILLVSCEYQLEETNYREIEPPSEYATMEINLNDIPPSDTIYIWMPTKFICSLNAGQRTIYQTDIRINNVPVSVSDFSQSNISFYVYPDRIGYGEYQLKVDCITSSGTGSLADLMGFEGYEFEAIWNIKVVKISDYFIGSYRILEDGQVELYWNNPLLPDSLITKCELYHYFSGYASYEELSPLQKSVLTNDYVCGKSTYTIKTSFKLEGIGYSYSQNSSYNGEIIIDMPIPKVYIEDLEKNKLRLYWDKPAVATNARYTVEYGRRGYGKDKISNIRDTSVVVSKLPIGSDFECTVGFYPAKVYPWASATSDVASFSYGKKVGFDSSNWFLYNTIENVIYTANIFNGSDIAIIDPNSLDVRYAKTDVYVLDYFTSSNSSKFGVMTHDKILVYNDSKLTSPVVVNVQREDNTSYILTNEFLFVFTQTASNIYDLATGSKINTLPTLGFRVKMSVDGRYFACINWNDSNIDVYMFDNSTFIKIGTHLRPNPNQSSYSNYHFHPSNSEQLIIECVDLPRNRTDLYKLSPFEKLQSTYLPINSWIQNIDPVTGLVMAHPQKLWG